jgi:sugar phosphate permease
MLFGYGIIERSLFGRRGTIFYGMLGTSVMSFLGWGLGFGFVLWVTMARAIVSVVFLVVYPFTLELYPTPIRGTALSMASGCARIGGIFTPWMVVNSFEKSPKGPFLIFALLAALGAFCTWKINTDTTNKELDIEMKEFEHVELK